MKQKVIIGSAIIFLIDQLSKLMIIKYLTDQRNMEVIKNVLDFTYVKNTGAAFSLFSGNIIFLIMVSILALFFIIALFLEELKTKKNNLIYYALVFGGVFGNLFDRIFRGYVVDFIDIKLFNFAIFNISDIAIVLGAGLIIFTTIKGEINEKNNNR